MSSRCPGGAPRFSIVVPALNEELALPVALAALQREANSQPLNGRTEVIVVDNGSTDGTAAIARRLGARVVLEPRRGVLHARQAGLEAARGEFVITTDADTIVPAGWLAAIDEAWRSCPQAAAVAGPCRYTIDSPRWGRLLDGLIFGVVTQVHRRTGWVVYVTATNLSFRRDTFPGYDLRLTQGGDEWGVLAQLRSAGPIVWLRDNPAHTSGRRLQRGVAHTLLVSGAYGYVFTYAVNRFTGRPLLGHAPAVRQTKEGSHRHGTTTGSAVSLVDTGFPAAAANAARVADLMMTGSHQVANPGTGRGRRPGDRSAEEPGARGGARTAAGVRAARVRLLGRR